jgi:hypothetical protein
MEIRSHISRSSLEKKKVEQLKEQEEEVSEKTERE